MRSVQRTITALLLTATVLGGASLLSGVITQLEQFQRDFGELLLTSASDEDYPNG